MSRQVKRGEIGESAVWLGGALLVVTVAGFGLYRLGRRVFGRKAGAR